MIAARVAAQESITVLVIDATANKICLKRLRGRLPVSSFSSKLASYKVFSAKLQQQSLNPCPKSAPLFVEY